MQDSEAKAEARVRTGSKEERNEDENVGGEGLMRSHSGTLTVCRLRELPVIPAR